MTESSALFSRTFLVASACVKWALRLLVLGWLVLGLVWCILHFVIVPRIDDLRPWLEQQASQAMGVGVRIGSMQATSNGLIPSLELKAVRLLDAQNNTLVELPLVVTAVSPRSLLAGGFEQIYIDSPELDVRRALDGQLWVAGFPLPQTPAQDSPATDWLLSQTEIVVRHGTLRWRDEMRNAPLLTLADVDMVVRQRHRTHSLRLDVSPPAHWGGRLSVQGEFKQPLLSTHAGRWQEWQGQLFSTVAKLDLAQLQPYADLGLGVQAGQGSLRAWIGISRGALTDATLDVALADVKLAATAALPAVTLNKASGRVALKTLDGGRQYATQGLQLDTSDGIHWPGGNVQVSLWDAQGQEGIGPTVKPARGEVVADRLDLAALRQLVQRLPLEDGVRRSLTALAPVGVVQTLTASWTGELNAPKTYAAKGAVQQLGVSFDTALGTPGIRGLSVEFDVSEAGGKANVAIQDGAIHQPGLLVDSDIAVQQLSADVQWKQAMAANSVFSPVLLSASASNLRFANADMQGEAQFTWSRSAPPAQSSLLSKLGVGKGKSLATPPRSAELGLGVLDLQGTLSRVDIAHVSRYMPMLMEKEVRDYLRESLLSGLASGVKFKVKGDLQNFPFEQAKQGEFKVSADISNASYAYVPPSQIAKGSLPWPVLTQLQGEFVMDHSTLSLNGVKALWGTTPNLPISRGDAVISNLYHASTVSVKVQGRGPLNDALAVINSSAVGDITGRAFNRTLATGAADYKVKLDFPLADTNRIKLSGDINLQGNDVQVFAGTPRLSRLKGTLGFTESGFTATGITGRALGGDVRLEGSLTGLGVASNSPSNKSSGVLRIQGLATAEGLRQANELAWVAGVAKYAQGSTPYQATVSVRGGAPELLVTSNLTGLASRLPEPLTKTAEQTLPLRLEILPVRVGGVVVKGQDQLRADLGRWVSLNYVRDVSTETARVLRGTIAVGMAAGESLAMPAQGVTGNITTDAFDVDAWTAVLADSQGAERSAIKALDMAQSYLPNNLAFKAREMQWDGRKLRRVVLGVTRSGALWRGNVESAEFSGYVEYREARAPGEPSTDNAGRLYARFSRMAIGSGDAQEVENLLNEQPASIPALDIVVDDFELQGKKLGRLEVEAINQMAASQREWRLKRFVLSAPDSVFNATGSWSLVTPTTGTPKLGSVKDRRRTSLNFKLDISDAGDALGRFGMKEVVRKGRGKIEGQVGWQGSPLSLDYPSMGGSFNVNVENGQFLKADPGIAKLLGVLSLQSLPRRLLLDFRDVFSEGFAFDFLRGDVTIDQGIARTNNLQMKGVNAAVLMEGSSDIAKETQSLKVVVIPELNAGSASLIASAINPVVGLSTFFAQWLLNKPLIEAGTQEMVIDGTWLEPRVTKVERSTKTTKPTTTVPAPPAKTGTK